MAPIRISPDNSPAPTAVILPWFMWLLIVLFAVVSTALLGWLTHWAVTKVQQILDTRKARKAEDELTLPTHLDPFAPRATVLPLPCSPMQEAKQKEHSEGMREKEEQQVQSTIVKVRTPAYSFSICAMLICA
jgi:hypothetical protein